MALRGDSMSALRKYITDKNVIRVIVVLLLIGFAIWSRLIPHPANVTALTAVSLLAGAVLPRRFALIIPLGAIIFSDLIIGLHSIVYATWGSFALIALLGMRLKDIKMTNVAVASFASSTIFFAVTNFAVWMEGRMYSMTFDGLVLCFTNAIPFYRNMMIGDFIYSAALFGLYAYSLKFLQGYSAKSRIVPTS